MSPEQCKGKVADTRSDIYAFGVVLYEMFTGTRAGPERTALRSRSLERIVRKCLANDPAERFQSAAEITSVLSGWRRRPLWKIALAAAAVVVMIAGVTLWRQAPVVAPLSDRDVLVVADFDNQTGDPVFDTALRQALAFPIGESPFLKAMDDEQVRQALQLSGRSSDTRVTGELARELCVREGEKVTLEGSIASLGTMYVLGLQAVNCHTGETIAREQAQAADKEHVIEVLAEAMTSMRVKLGRARKSPAGVKRSHSTRSEDSLGV